MPRDQIQQILKRLDNHEKRIRVLETREGFLKKGAATDDSTAATGNNLVLLIVNKIGDCEECDAIESKILDKRNAERKILLCFYISYKYFKNAWLTTGDIEKITSELGVKIDVRNVTNKIKELRQYLESGTTRKKGQPTPYRLNRKGVRRVEEILAKD